MSVEKLSGGQKSPSDSTSRQALASESRTGAAAPHQPSRRGVIAVITAVAVMVIGAIVVPSLSTTAEPERDAAVSGPSPLPVNTVRVGSVPGPTMSQRYAGLLVARRESDLSFERGGRVTRIAAREGSFVQQGALLAELDQEDLDAAADRARSELAMAQAVLDELVAGPREQSIRAAEAKVEELAARVELAKIDAGRQQQLAPRGATSRSELDSAVFGLQASENSLRAAQALLDELKAGSRQEKIVAQKASCDAIRASLREIEADRSDSRIHAPFAGTISRRNIDEGVVVDPGNAVLRLVSGAVEAQVGLPPRIASGLATGDKVSVWLHEEQRDAWVDRIEPVVRRETRTRVVFLRFHPQSVSPSADGQNVSFGEHSSRGGWVAGEVVAMQMARKADAQSDQAFWLPRSALIRGSRGLWSVLVVAGDDGPGVCQRRAVEILKTDGQSALVQGMLESNERVVSNGLHRITAGMRVAPQGDAGTQRDAGIQGDDDESTTDEAELQ